MSAKAYHRKRAPKQQQNKFIGSALLRPSRSISAVLRKAVVFYTAISQEEIPKDYDVDAIDHITKRGQRPFLVPLVC